MVRRNGSETENNQPLYRHRHWKKAAFVDREGSPRFLLNDLWGQSSRL